MAEAAPPLGTILGNLGVNAQNFCTSFNLFTQKIPNYFLLKVTIFIYDNRTTTFKISLPSIGFILNILKFERTIKVKIYDKWHEKTIFCISLYEILKLARFKFPELNLESAFLLIWGSVRSMNLIIIR